MAGETASAVVAVRFRRRIVRSPDTGVDRLAGQYLAGRSPLLVSGVGGGRLRMRLMSVAGNVMSRPMMVAVAGMRARNGRNARGENSRKANQPENCANAVHRLPLPGPSGSIQQTI
jgi:hypothetical protein